MAPIRTLAVLFSCLNALTSAAFCSAFWGFNEDGETQHYITHVSVTLTVPPLTNSIGNNVLYLWPGVIASTGLLQPVLSHGTHSYCSAGETYCALAGRYSGTASTPFLHGQVGQVSVGDKLLMDIKYDGNGKTTQTITRGGAVISQVTTGGDNINKFHFRAEYDGSTAATSPAHVYNDLTITFGTAHPNLPAAIGSNLVTSSGLTTSDGGITWKASKIQFAQSPCPAS